MALKYQVGGNFAHNCKEAGCYLKQTDPCYPWQNSDEGGIKNLKRGAGCKMFQTRSTKRLWDDCVELEACVCSHTAQDIYCLNVDTPETIMSDETSEISQFC